MIPRIMKWYKIGQQVLCGVKIRIIVCTDSDNCKILLIIGIIKHIMIMASFFKYLETHKNLFQIRPRSRTVDISSQYEYETK